MRTMTNKKSDVYLYLFLSGLIISIVLFILTNDIRAPPLDASMEWSDGSFRITLTGIAEIIVAVGCAFGAFFRLKG